MGRLGTALVVGGILVLGVLAAADAFRSGGAKVVAEPTTSTVHPQGRPTLAGTLGHDAIQGTLIYSDERCGVRSILLPSLHRDLVTSDRTGKQVRGCTFSFAAGHFLRGEVARTHDGPTIARCTGQRVVVRNVETRGVLARATGCPVAWRTFQNGRSQLTQFRHGEIVADGDVLISHAQLVAAARKQPNLVGLAGEIPLRVSVIEFAWPDEHRCAAILEASAQDIQVERMLVLLDDGRLTGFSANFGGLIQHLVVSPDGAYVASEPGTVMRTRDGDSWTLPQSVGIAHVFAFSPDERWLAVGTRASVFLVSVTDVETNEQTPKIDRVPIIATDLAWEAAGAGATDTSTTAR